jgi:uncharacterized membrane protein YdjX (TVP38/TMEM64 family)
MSRRALVIAGLLAAVLLAWWLAPVAVWAEAAADWLRGAGLWGVLLFSLAYVLSALLLAPATIPTLIAGSIWGLGWGALLVHGVGMVADTIPFLIARRWGRGRLGGALGLDRHAAALRRIDAALERDGFRLVCLLRWFPLAPFNLMNYLLGLSRVSLRAYLAATFVACVPNTIIFVYLGTVVPRLRDGGGGLWSEPALIAALAVLAVAATLGLGRAARGALEAT